MKIILIDNYDSFTFNLYHYLSSFSKVDVFRNDKVDHHFNFKKKLKKIKNDPNKKPIKTWSRKSTIIPDFVGISF